MSKSNSVGHAGGLLSWISENGAFLQMRLRGLSRKNEELELLLGSLDDMGRRYARESGRDISSAKILEIGYGARPLRMFTWMSLGYDIRGIDLDQPVLGHPLLAAYRIFRSNGLGRAVKSAVRGILFDAHERRTLDQLLRKRGAKLRIEQSRFLVGDAARFQFDNSELDFIFSVDVFEHIPPPALKLICSNLGRALADNGIAMFTPAVYTGIAGGHLVEWYPHMLKNPEVVRASEPWEHLRLRRVHADCFLNELRVQDYHQIFSEYFDIVEVINNEPNIGLAYLTPAIRAELSDYSEEELTSHTWTFVLRKKGYQAKEVNGAKAATA